MKKIFATVAVSTLMIASCGDLISKASSVSTTAISSDTTFDVVSSASKKIKVDGGRIYADSIQVNVWYQYDNGVTWAQIVDDNGAVVSIDTLNRAPYSFQALTVNTYSVTGLKPSTHYTLTIDGLYNGADRWTIPEISFTTRARMNLVDSVTKNSVAIKQIETFADSAKIVFNYKYNKGITIAKVIAPSGVVVLADTLSKLLYNYPVNTDNSHILKKLLPETTYGLVIEGLYDNGVKLLPWANDTMFFTTTKSSAEPSYKIDAISSASKKIKVNSGDIFADSLKINLWYMYNNGFTWAKVINEQGNQVLFKTLSLDESGPAAGSNFNLVLKPLSPGTKYRLVIDGNFDGGTEGNPDVHTNVNNDINWSLDTIPFTTRK